MRPKPPTDAQVRVYEIVCEFIADHGQPPTVREIVRIAQFASPQAVSGHLKSLVRKGQIEHIRGKARGIWPKGMREELCAMARAWNETRRNPELETK